MSDAPDWDAALRKGTKVPLRDMRIGETRLFMGRDADDIAKRYWCYKPMKFRSRTVVVRGMIAAKTRRIA